MSRYFIEIAYNGSNYHGWQFQQNATSIQEEINKALSTILQTDTMVTGAGRTDTGVHAEQLYAHFDFEQLNDLETLKFKLNNFLPNDISIYSIFEVNKDAHARFSATSRTYQYRITQKKNPFHSLSAYYFPYPLNIELMNKAAAELLNYKDFSSFSKSKTDTFTNNCEIIKAEWEAENGLLVFTITANRFLRNMVRAIVGTLLEIGQEKIKTSELKEIIESKNRSNAGTSAPAQGLFLTKINYPNSIY